MICDGCARSFSCCRIPKNGEICTDYQSYEDWEQDMLDRDQRELDQEYEKMIDRKGGPDRWEELTHS